MIRSLLLFSILMLFLQGCSIITISRYGGKETEPVSFQPSPGLFITPTGAVHIAGPICADFFPASFRIESLGKVIYIDPLVIDNPKPADYIFITHAHMDHLSLTDIRKIVKKETIIISPHTAVKSLKNYSVREVKPGDLFELGGVKCETVAAYNLKPGFLWMVLHPKSDCNVGYILTIGGARIYHAGDTDYIPEMKHIKDITVALVPVGTGNTAMDPKQSSDFINTLKPRAVVPMHYELGKNAARDFKRMVNKSVRVEILQPGEE
jgi:L-ascorbate metabolism protein UlaG (beta-lactamase superfamily)